MMLSLYMYVVHISNLFWQEPIISKPDIKTLNAAEFKIIMDKIGSLTAKKIKEN
jgi:hypothetical protein